MTGMIFTSPVFTALDTTGIPLDGAKWYFYRSGTLTPVDTYTTSGMGTAHANPVVAGLDGKFPPIYLDSSIAYRGILKDKNDNLVSNGDVDPVSFTPISGSEITFLQAGTGADVRTTQNKLREYAVSVKDFGAVGDGTTDDTASFTEWYNYIRTNYREGFIPIGTYRLTAPVAWVANAEGDSFPYHSLNIRGEDMQETVLLFDYPRASGAIALNINQPDLGGAFSTGLRFSYIGNFTVQAATNRGFLNLVKVSNMFSSTVENIFVRPWASAATSVDEFFRVGSGVQWVNFRNIVIDPIFTVDAATVNPWIGVGISIGNGYKDGPNTNQYAISNNTFYDCLGQYCNIAFLTEAADATTFMAPKAIACEYGYTDRASFATAYVNPWNEGQRINGFYFDAATITDSTGTSSRKTQYPQIVGGYVGNVYIVGAIGANLQCALNVLEVTAAAQRVYARILGQDGVTVTDNGSDSQIEWFRTSDNRHVKTIGGFENSYETPAGTKLLTLSDSKGVGIILKAGIGPTINGEMVFQHVTDTQVNIRYQGTDGVVRTLTGISGGALTFA